MGGNRTGDGPVEIAVRKLRRENTEALLRSFSIKGSRQMAQWLEKYEEASRGFVKMGWIHCVHRLLGSTKGNLIVWERKEEMPP